MAQGSFSARISQWAKDIPERAKAVRDDAAQATIEIMQTPGPSVANPGNSMGGNLPIDTGFLRSTLVGMVGTTLPMTRENPDPNGKYSYSPGPINLVLLDANLTDTITVAYAANYAEFAEARYAFVRLATQQWPQTVDASCAKIRAAAEARSGA